MTPQLLLFCREHEAAKKFFVDIPHDAFGVNLVQDEIYLGQLLDKQRYALLIVDCLKQTEDEIDLIKSVRKRSAIPILITSRESSSDKRALFFESGADDCISLPVGKRELLARIRAKVDEKSLPVTGLAKTRILDINGVRLDPNTREVSCNTQEVRLTGKEFNILHTLMRHPGIVVNKKQLYQQALNAELTPLTRGVDTHICNIRRKLKSASQQELLHTVRGVGYIFLYKTNGANAEIRELRA